MIGTGLLAAGSGMAQFGVTAVLGDVAVAFGQATEAQAADVAMSATTLGLGLAVIRVAGIGSLLGASLADRLGRRRVMLVVTAFGMVFTGLSAAMPGYWTFIIMVAMARPLLSTTNALGAVVASEESTTAQRPAALAFIAAAYGIGTGAIPLMRAAVDGISFRVVLGVCAIPLVVFPFIARAIREPEVAERAPTPRERLGSVPLEHRRNLMVLSSLIGLIAVATGPAFTYLYVYGERTLGLSAGTMFSIVLLAGPTGLLGLIIGSMMSGRFGRRWTAAFATAATLGFAVVAYSGSTTGFVVGYLAGITASSAFGLASGALLNELFPTSCRATANGWAALSGVTGAVTGLLLFGWLADTTGSYSRAAMYLLPPLIPVVILYRWLPETSGRELDELDAAADYGSGQTS